MSFASPAFLVGLALIPVLVVLYTRAERRPQSFAPAELLPSVVPSRPGWRRHAAIAGYAVALAILLVALAKPQATIAVPTEQARVMIVTDHSGSMQATDVAPNRLAAAKKAAGTFLAALPTRCASERSPSTRRPTCCSRRRATTMRSREAIQHQGRRHHRHRRRDQGRARDDHGQGARRDRAASDGKSVRGSDPIAAARAAKRRKIPIYTVALGTPGGRSTAASRCRPTRDARRIAKVTGGRAFTARTTKAARPGLQAPRLTGGDQEAETELTILFAGGALALMLLSAPCPRSA